jgi:hypothetical protein
MLYLLAAAAFAVAAVAAALPLLASGGKVVGVSPADRATWVNRLFGLAGKADASGEAAIAAAARALIAALVSEKELPKKAR